MSDLEDRIREDLVRDIGIKRFEHSLRVIEVAMKLCDIYKVDRDKAYISCLLHDCGKFQDENNLLKHSHKFDIILDEVMMDNKELIHAPLSAKIAEYRYGIDDRDILSAICYHTTGKEDMTLLEKIVFISDYIEPARSFPGVDEVRNLVYKDIDRSIVLAMDNTIGFLISRNKLISDRTVNARNDLMISIKRRG